MRSANLSNKNPEISSSINTLHRYGRELAALVTFFLTPAYAFDQNEKYAQSYNSTGAIGSMSAVEVLDQEDEYSFFKRQIEIGEASEASVLLQEKIVEIEDKEHLTHRSLVKPLTLLGDAKVAAGFVKEGLLFYDRAIFVQRVNFGLFDSAQVDIIYKEADGLKLLGDLEEARKREEYAFEVIQRAYKENDLRRIPGLVRLAKFYDSVNSYLASRIFYRKSLEILIANNREWEIESIPLYNGIAQSYFRERFPPSYIVDGFDSQLMDVVPGLTDAERLQQTLSINNFPEGERALQAAVKIALGQEPKNTELIEETTMRLGDWHLMWNRQREANTLYTSVYQSMESRGIDPNVTFSKPNLLYLPEPKTPEPPGLALAVEVKKGIVEVKFLVKTNGRVAALETVRTEPPKLMEFKIRRSLRNSVFRPAFFEGIPVKNYPYTFVYKYDYFPSENLADPTP